MNTREATLELFTVKNVVTEIILVSVAILMPVLLHLVPGVNVFALLPMHWTIFAAGLLYGWRGGLIAGLSAPCLSFMMTGMPVAMALPLMVPELAVYGLVSGILREKTKINQFVILLAASAAGRITYLAFALVLGRVENLTQFAAKAFLPGAIAALAIIAVVPFMAKGIRTLLEGSAEK